MWDVCNRFLSGLMWRRSWQHGARGSTPAASVRSPRFALLLLLSLHSHSSSSLFDALTRRAWRVVERRKGEGGGRSVAGNPCGHAVGARRRGGAQVSAERCAMKLRTWESDELLLTLLMGTDHVAARADDVVVDFDDEDDVEDGVVAGSTEVKLRLWKSKARAQRLHAPWTPGSVQPAAMQRSEFQGSGFMGSALRVQGSGFRVQG